MGVKVEICEDCEALLQLERVDITVRMGRMEWGVVRAEPDRSSSDVYELCSAGFVIPAHSHLFIRWSIVHGTSHGSQRRLLSSRRMNLAALDPFCLLYFLKIFMNFFISSCLIRGKR